MRNLQKRWNNQRRKSLSTSIKDPQTKMSSSIIRLSDQSSKMQRTKNLGSCQRRRKIRTMKIIRNQKLNRWIIQRRRMTNKIEQFSRIKSLIIEKGLKIQKEKENWRKGDINQSRAKWLSTMQLKNSNLILKIRLEKFRKRQSGSRVWNKMS